MLNRARAIRSSKITMNASDAFVRAALLQSCEKSEILKHIDLNNTDNETLRLLINKYNRLSIRKIPIILIKYITKSGLEFLKRQFPRVGSYITPENISVDVADDELACLVETENDYKPSIYILVLKNISISVLGSTIETFKSSLLNSGNSAAIINNSNINKNKQDENYKVKIRVNESDELENKITDEGKISVHEDTEPFKKVETPQHYTDIFSPKNVENNDDYMSSASSTSSILSSSLSLSQSLSVNSTTLPKYKQKTQQTTIETIRNNNHKLYNDNKTFVKQNTIDEKRLIIFDENNNKLERSLSMSSTKSSSSNRSIHSLSSEVSPSLPPPLLSSSLEVTAKSLPELITNEDLNNLNKKQQENESKIIILENCQIKPPIFNIPKPIIPSEVPSSNNMIISDKLLNHQFKEQVLAKQQQKMEIEDDNDAGDNDDGKINTTTNDNKFNGNDYKDDEIVSLDSSDDEDDDIVNSNKLIDDEEKKINNLRSLKSGDFELPKMKKSNDDFINLITANGFSPTRQQQRHHLQSQQKLKISIDDDY